MPPPRMWRLLLVSMLLPVPFEIVLPFELLGERTRRSSAFYRAAAWRKRAPTCGSSSVRPGAWQR